MRLLIVVRNSDDDVCVCVCCVVSWVCVAFLPARVRFPGVVNISRRTGECEV